MSCRVLISGQDVVFDTHQAGDGRPIRVEDLHLEKRLHSGGKIRFPLFGEGQPRSSGLNEAERGRVIREVERALSKDPVLVRELARVVYEQLSRFSQNTASLDDARQAARSIAVFFKLGEEFVNEVAAFHEGKLVQFVTHHRDPDSLERFEIRQRPAEIEIRKAKKRFVAHYDVFGRLD